MSSHFKAINYSAWAQFCLLILGLDFEILITTKMLPKKFGLFMIVSPCPSSDQVVQYCCVCELCHLYAFCLNIWSPSKSTVCSIDNTVRWAKLPIMNVGEAFLEVAIPVLYLDNRSTLKVSQTTFWADCVSHTKLLLKWLGLQYLCCFDFQD